MKPSECPLYIASPLGFSEAGRDFYNQKFLPAIVNQGFPILDPWKIAPQEEIDRILSLPYGVHRIEELRRINRIIGSGNERAIIGSKGIIAILDGADVDSGTSAEIGFGHGQGKIILGYRGDFRLSSENEGATVNIQVEYFILKSGGKIVKTLDELTSSLKEIFLRDN